MDIDSKKQWLWRYREQMFKAQSLWRQAQEWKELIYTPSCKVLDGMPKNETVTNRFENDILKHLELTEEATEASLLAKNIRKEVVDAIDTIENVLGVQVLTLRYIENFSWSEIQKQLHYSKTHIRNIHVSALKDIKINSNCDLK